MIRPVLKMGDPRLWRRAKPVEEFGARQLHALVDDLRETMRQLDGAGLAAPQIGVDLRLVVFGVSNNPRYPDAEAVPWTVLANPVLTPLGDEVDEGWEGCLSVPGLRGWVARAARLHYTGFDADGRPVERTVGGFHARLVQHECDHLDGVLYPMRMRDFTRFGFVEALFPGDQLAADGRPAPAAPSILPSASATAD
ncbi:MAG TPA: peptide deformylase [Accumulibacter sp.]|uniref:peptide deformylase n=1 Tax=Accumulibacter sp. TaxID=2053492 RepID=UPI002878CEF8|nr:peptide deformylase [Accumulibacter sp.]MDS4054878.1 peptide deformylase [Accumulibacter sp.]HMV05758.1 peptide deformylase [Accumulibacter sp.]HMW63080.1 peptide deformylase [Accumulibacter sp.]HMW79605.1 peptide deformylase [Accumulibacter sp.]HMX68415.1 peptide deformylase [Accumulibacter sp.]